MHEPAPLLFLCCRRGGPQAAAAAAAAGLGRARRRPAPRRPRSGARGRCAPGGPAGGGAGGAAARRGRRAAQVSIAAAHGVSGSDSGGELQSVLPPVQVGSSGPAGCASGGRGGAGVAGAAVAGAAVQQPAARGAQQLSAQAGRGCYRSDATDGKFQKLKRCQKLRSAADIGYRLTDSGGGRGGVSVRRVEYRAGQSAVGEQAGYWVAGYTRGAVATAKR